MMWYEVVWRGEDGLSVGMLGGLELVERSMTVATFFPKDTAAREGQRPIAAATMRAVGFRRFRKKNFGEIIGCYFAASQGNAVGLESLNRLFSLKR
jgi:hypothetical protein